MELAACDAGNIPIGEGVALVTPAWRVCGISVPKTKDFSHAHIASLFYLGPELFSSPPKLPNPPILASMTASQIMSISSAPSSFSPTPPQALAPANPPPANNLQAPMSASLQVQPSLTKKEWVVPPRPKPGRKPAADAPPTKRKAQNRAAQRAFRERRAARVGDLEEQMREMEEREGKGREEMRARLQELETNVENYNRLLLSWQDRYSDLQIRFDNERKLREDAERAMLGWRESMGDSTDVVPLPPRHQRAVHDGGQRYAAEKPNVMADEPSMGCGGCSQGSRCECIEQVLGMGNMNTDASTSAMNRPLSPVSPIESQPPPQYSVIDHSNLEIDFTTRFSHQRPTPLANSTNSSSAPQSMLDPCGFCQDGTPCICAEMAAETSSTAKRSSNSSTAYISASPVPVKENPCANGPGTCAQCLSSSNSTLFCKSLAATRANRTRQVQTRPSSRPNSGPPGSLAGGGGVGGVGLGNTSTPAPRPVGSTGLTLSCADTFTTLSRHPAFDRANEELESWMPQLATVPGSLERTAFEVEAASVMGVLKFFDRRFGSDKK